MRVTDESGARRPVPSHATAWAPKTERIHQTAESKLGSSRDIPFVRHDELEEEKR